jgi:superfamily II DNA or RNA helicase
MQQHNLGQLIYPTGGGKTLNMIMDAVRQFQSTTPQTVVVVAPRILLAEQLSSEFLEFITNAVVFHCHSGETHHESSTRPAVISQWVEDNQSSHKLIVTTYNSLQRLVDAEIDVDTIYFDEAHNSSNVTSFLQRSTSLPMQIVASSLLQPAKLQ